MAIKCSIVTYKTETRADTNINDDFTGLTTMQNTRHRMEERERDEDSQTNIKNMIDDNKYLLMCQLSSKGTSYYLLILKLYNKLNDLQAIIKVRLTNFI